MTENTTAAPAAPATGNPVPPAQEADIQERINGFNKELLPLLGKYELGLAAMPKINPDGRVFADPIVVSVRGRTDAAQNQQTGKPAEPTSKAGLATE